MDTNMSENVVVMNHKKLNMEKIKNNDDLLQYLALDYETWDIVNDEIEKYNDCNYKEITLKIVNSGNEYTIVHGFPGDEPAGCVLLENDEFLIMGGKESTNSDLIAIENWYWQITRECCDFKDTFWY
jgi:hypothetical protein